MKIVFFGTSQFAVPGLKRLIASRYSVIAVVTQPDRKQGRRLKTAASPVKEIALDNNKKIFQPETLSDDFIGDLKTLSPDLFIVIAYGHILKKDILEIPRYYALNLHASLLPKYRGAAPINWAILKGDKKTGVTIIKMNEHMDRGDIIARAEEKIEDNDTSLSLREKLSHTGADLLLRTVSLIENKKEKFEKQNEKYATYARKLTKEDGLIDWSKTAIEVHNKVRGTIPWPGAYTSFEGKTLKILKTEVLDITRCNPGEVIKAEGSEFIIGTNKGAIKILELQPEAGKRMDTSSFLRGHKLKVGTILA